MLKITFIVPVKEDLTIGSDLTDNFADLGLKTHVQHTIGFVKDQIRATSQVRLAHFKKIHQTTGRGDDDFCALFEVADLRSFWGT